MAIAPARQTLAGQPPTGLPVREAEAASRRSRLIPFSAADRAVLWLYLFTRTGIWVTAYCTGWLFTGDGTSKQAPPLMSRWEQWDWAYFVRIAQYGYFDGPLGPGSAHPDNREAFFPGFPLLLRAVHAVVRDWTLAGLLISFVAGGVAVLALGRIARLELRDRVPGRVRDGLRDSVREGAGDIEIGPRAVLFLLLSPCAVFLAVGYSEALFLAFALPAWLAARKGNWPQAALLAFFATSVRISGLFLVAALAVQFATAGDLRRRLRSLPWLAVPVLPALGYAWYLQTRTGDWMAWKHAQERGWYRQFHAPWDAWSNTWDAAFSATYTTGYALLFRAELVAMVVGVLLLGVLLIRRRWPEAAYIGLTLWALGTSYWYMSIPRASLLWWPLWIGLARWSLRRPWVRTAYICVAAPLMTVLAVAFTSGRWAG
ncbi:mannosyltransferase family protein [Streptomyces sp. H10-C2]|uniref:mannosyltransferase family protein n=1 Tax=unclassified Streptomyces TaxID=2593676 RepID=UPI0024B8A3BC|nr:MULTISPECIES: mannosyltransferase family protein [unclassified Streptomyces]MDJ0342133.1 mannosyltransferase family protein [Streptomyces sp. PH10-H1]MDJ0368475.1 mannosyltransferase family protein [Streptomyces sp. H10-C2]